MTAGVLTRAILAWDGPHRFAAHQHQHGYECHACGRHTDEAPRADDDGLWVHPTCAGDPKR